MRKNVLHRIRTVFLVLAFLLLAFYGGSALDAVRAPGYWTPKDPPRAEYVLEAEITIDGHAVSLAGTGTMALENTTSKPISVLAWEWSGGSSFEVSTGGKKIEFLNEAGNMPLATPLLIELPEPLKPGRKIRLDVRFTTSASVTDGQIQLKSWYPRLWWEGLPTADVFRVKIESPQTYALAASGRLNPKTGCYENDCVTTHFGLFLSNAMETDSRESEGVLVTALFTEKGKECARFCLEAASDIIKFYKKWLGVYPHKSLCIIPGGPQPMGGYPYASGIVVIHGQETFDPGKGEKALNWWRWITAHEIGHQYWGEFIIPADVRGDYTESWLMIAMGICMDKAYMLTRGHGWDRHRAFIDRYLAGAKGKLDTTMDAPPSLARTQKFDTNNILIHGKGFAVLSALETALGPEDFERIYRRTVAGFQRKRLGWRDFRRLAEDETGEDLGWFFDDWVRSNKVLEVRVVSQSSTPEDGGYLSEVRVEYGMDSIRMPVPVRAVFEDGTSETRMTDRLARSNVLRFRSRSKLKEAHIDSDGRIAVVREPIARSAAELEAAVGDLDWTGTGEAALEIFKKPEAADIKASRTWFKLGLLLYDGKHYPESFEAFKKCGEVDNSDQNLFGAFVWMGNIKDILGEREAAVVYYQEALKHDTGRTLQHDQYGMRINKAWVEERLRTPFKRVG